MHDDLYTTVLCTWRLTASMVNDAGGVIFVKLTVKLVIYAVNCQSLVMVTPFFTIVIYGAIFEWRRMCTTLIQKWVGCGLAKCVWLASLRCIMMLAYHGVPDDAYKIRIGSALWQISWYIVAIQSASAGWCMLVYLILEQVYLALFWTSSASPI
jgi:hypothetical protein